MKLYGKLIQRGFLIRRLLNPSSPQNYMASFCVSTREFASSSVFKSGSLPAVYGRLNSSPFSQFDSGNLSFLKGQRRNMFIQTKNTPNPDSLMFCPGQPVMEVGSADFPNSRSAMNSPLAKALYGVDGVTRVFYGSEFVTVTKSDDISWDLLKPQVFAEIMDFYSSGKPLFIDAETAASKDTAIHEDDSETVAMIKELLETRIRPAVQDDGGDIEYCGFDPETGIVKLTLQGACSGCPSSSVTLKSGIENMLMHYVPEVRGVEQAMDDADTDNEDETGTSQSDTAGKDDTVESQMAPGAKSHSA